MIDCSIIIVNYNVKDFLDQALQSIQKSIDFASGKRPGFTSEIFVVDNASEDGSVQMVRTKFPRVQCIINTQNVGFAKANNQALALTKGKYILLINPDTIIQEDTLYVMIDLLENNKDIGMAGCKILNPDGTLQLACRRSFPTPWVAFTKITGLSALMPKTKLFGRYNLTYLNPDESYEVDAISGSFMMLRREVYEIVGGLDETYFMYGEDLDWCYRIQKAEWKIYYVSETKIIHYKGESTRRSDIDAIKTFYQAMSLFVEKNITGSPFVKIFLNTTIWVRAFIAWIGKSIRMSMPAVVDFVLLNVSVVVAEYLWLNRVFHFPAYAYPTIFIIPPLILIVVMGIMGGYTHRRYSISQAVVAVIITFTLISAITFFFRDYAFSRMVVLISGAISILLIPGWRLLIRMLGKMSGVGGVLHLAPRRTILVGVNPGTQEIIKKLRRRIHDSYNIVGIIDVTRQRVGEKIGETPIIGSISHIGKIISEERVTDVIFVPESLQYSDILSVIAKTKERTVNYKLIPTHMEVVIGKGVVDQLDELPLIEIEYRIDQPMNRFIKRAFDFMFALFLIATVYPIKKVVTVAGSRKNKNWIDDIPKVVSGKMSFVGPPEQTLTGNGDFLGKPGLTGIVQLQHSDELQPDEIQGYNLYYAKNQSLLMDIEILLKSFILQFTPKTSRR